MIHRLSAMGADAQTVIDRLEKETDITTIRALLLSLGEFDEKVFPAGGRQVLLQKVQDLYRDNGDPGLHAAAEWLLRRWRQEAWLKRLNEEWAKDKGARQRRLDDIQRLLLKENANVPLQWYVNGLNQTMIVIPGRVQFVMGLPRSEFLRFEEWSWAASPQHRKRIMQTYALASKPVTVEQFLQFRKGHPLPDRYKRMAGLPVVAIDWYLAASYCNWLSEQEGIPESEWCFVVKGNTVTLKANYLGLHGYRLPTEAEVEYATRAKAVTARCFGETDELLPKYAWYLANSEEMTWPVGSLKPNDFGLFDVHGNVLNWCQEGRADYPSGEQVDDDKEDDELMVKETRMRVMRGSSFYSPGSISHSAFRLFTMPTYPNHFYGFRVARTLGARADHDEVEPPAAKR